MPLDGLETNPDGLRRACHTVGLFYLDLGNHALPRRALAACAQFFALPDGAKAQMDVSNSPQWRGYIALGRENTQGKPDWREQVEFGAERPPLAGAFDAGRPLFERLIGPNQWYGAHTACRVASPIRALRALPRVSVPCLQPGAATAACSAIAVAPRSRVARLRQCGRYPLGADPRAPVARRRLPGGAIGATRDASAAARLAMCFPVALSLQP